MGGYPHGTFLYVRAQSVQALPHHDPFRVQPMTTRTRPRKAESQAVKLLVTACKELLSERGEASLRTRAQATLAAYARLNAEEQHQFFQALQKRFAPDARRALAAAEAYARDRSSKNLRALTAATEPPRQELLRRLNRAPGGTRAIVSMREALLDALRVDPDLAQVDDDFQHLLSSWFNPGFLQMVRVDWNTPAALLEQLIRHEAVHAIRGWDDLRRRLQDDRRCFAFFHPVLPHAPLIFVEVALLAEMPAAVAPLLDVAGPKAHAHAYRTAVFYGISNCEPGLRGVSLGNFLIKQVALQLADEFAAITQFCTLSPIPGFRRWVDHVASGSASFANHSQKTRDAVHRLRAHASQDGTANRTDPPASQADLELLCATYLAESGKSTGVNSDPVARFHLNNGARLERINPQADLSPKGLAQSFGMMVNYVYDLRQIERNHESFVEGRVGMSRKIRRLVS